MKTISAINTLLREYELRIERSVSKTDKDFNKDLSLAQKDLTVKFNKLRQILPDLVQVNYDSAASSEETESIIRNLRSRVQGKFITDLLPTGETMKKTIYGSDFFVPLYAQWQSEPSNANFVISYDKSTQDKAVKAFNCLVSNMLISLPAKAVHLNFVDLNFSGWASLFTKNLDKSMYRDLIVDSLQLDSLCKEMQARMVTALQECGDLPKYNAENQFIRYPYEVIVLLDYPNMYDNVSDLLTPLFQNGHKGGIYFVVLNNNSISLSDNRKSVLSLKDHYYEIDLEKITSTDSGVVRVTSLLDNKTISAAVFDYINDEASKQPEVVPIKQDYDKLYRTPYKNTDSVIDVPVGKTENGEIVSFVMDTVSHVHSFIIGASGSGKSVFLHNIIAAAMLKYSPEDLKFYLLDFKIAGVEFNRYLKSKHVEALLVDNSDSQTTLEILRGIKDAMKERGETFRREKGNINNISEYNKKNPDSRMPQIFLVVDECHIMFKTDDKNRKDFREISDIVTMIAKEGRNQGVHLILATQTLAQTEIPSEILNNISDHYLLKCAPSDSDKMVEGSSAYTAQLTTGHVYYHHVTSNALFQAFYTLPHEVGKVTDMIVRKAEQRKANRQFYFNGAQIFTIDNATISSLPAKRNPIASLGYSISMKREPINIPIKQDDGENILFFGINDVKQVTRAVMNALITATLSSGKSGSNRKVKVFDLIDADEGDYLDELDIMKNRGLIELVSKRDCGNVLYCIAHGIASKKVEPTILVILGQEKMRGLKNDLEIEDFGNSNDSPSAATSFGDPSVFGNFAFKEPSSDAKDNKLYNTYRKALKFILDKGPGAGVNTLLQVDKPGHLLFNDNLRREEILSMFNHMIMFHTNANAYLGLGLDDDIRLENLSSDLAHLRAYHYFVENDTYQLFTPYTKVDGNIF